MLGTDRYYQLLNQIRRACSRHRYEEALALAYESLPLVPELIAACTRRDGQFDITSIPAIETVARFASAQGDVTRLTQLRTWIDSISELAPWIDDVDQRIKAATIQPAILQLAESHPGFLQNKVPKALGVSGRLTGRLIVDMEHLGLIRRTQSGKSYALHLPGRTIVSATPRSVVRVGSSEPSVDLTDTWIALDFETATPERHSACALGAAVIQRGEIVSCGAWYMRPPSNEYDSRNISVHGITPDITEQQPTYRELYETIAPFLEGQHVIAHWATFDMSVLRALHEYYAIPLPDMHYVCSCRMAQRAFPQLQNHRLPTVCEHCEIPLEHHDPASDVAACASVALECSKAVGTMTIRDAVRALGVTVHRL